MHLMVIITGWCYAIQIQEASLKRGEIENDELTNTQIILGVFYAGSYEGFFFWFRASYRIYPPKIHFYRLSMNYQAIVTATQRLTILKLLAEQPNYIVHYSVLHAAINNLDMSGISFDKLTGELSWLEEQGLITQLSTDTTAVKITTRGLDIAMQRANHPGVSKPLPDDQG